MPFSHTIPWLVWSNPVWATLAGHLSTCSV